MGEEGGGGGGGWVVVFKNNNYCHFLFLNKNQGTSNEYPQHKFLQRTGEIIPE